MSRPAGAARRCVSGPACWATSFVAGVLLASGLVTPAAADNPAPAECTPGQIKVTPGAWIPTGIHLEQGDVYSVTASGYMWFTTGSDGKPNSARNGGWGPDGHADPLGFGGANGLKGEVEGSGNGSTDLGGSGSGAASRSGQLVLGEARTYQPNPDNKTTVSGWYCVTVSLPSPPAPSSTLVPNIADAGSDCLDSVPPELVDTAPAARSVPIDALSQASDTTPAEDGVQVAAASARQQPISPPQVCTKLITFAVLGADEDQPFVQYAGVDTSITAPRSLDEVIAALQAATRDGSHISRLYFLAHAGVSQPVSPATTFMELGGKDYAAADFTGLKSRAPNISRVFARNAVITLLNCDLGKDPAFVAAIADLFLGSNGGYVDAKTGSVAIWNRWLFSVETPESPSRFWGDGDWIGWHLDSDAGINGGFRQFWGRPPTPAPPDSTSSPGGDSVSDGAAPAPVLTP